MLYSYSQTMEMAHEIRTCCVYFMSGIVPRLVQLQTIPSGTGSNKPAWEVPVVASPFLALCAGQGNVNYFTPPTTCSNRLQRFFSPFPFACPVSDHSTRWWNFPHYENRKSSDVVLFTVEGIFVGPGGMKNTVFTTSGHGQYFSSFWHQSNWTFKGKPRVDTCSLFHIYYKRLNRKLNNKSMKLL